MVVARRAVPMGSWAVAPPSSLRCLGSRAGPPDPYEVLGVRPGATAAEIRAAFLQRCKEVHPDGDPQDPSRHTRFLLLAEAYGTLSSPRTPPRDPPRDTPPPRSPPRRGETPRPGSPPRSDHNQRYWEQFRPPGGPPGAPPRRLLGLCLLLAALGGVVHALAYRYVAGAHAAFLDERDRVLRAAYERARSRAGSREEVLGRLRASLQRGRGGGGGR